MLRRDAHLTCVTVTACRDARRRPSELRIRENERARIAAKLEHEGLVLRDLAHAKPDGLRAGKAYALHTRVFDCKLRHASVAADHVQHAGRHTARFDQSGEREGRAQRERRRLQDHRIASG